ncbi:MULTISPECIES: FtsB family cell division protein [Prolixibacter]|uniref:Septum formation initiator n=1 Tax=Prolixibacter denitrificans TaxID=1541063 RepID=A0A2P8CK49_9BACT|nr:MULTISPECIES: septum formation initiator family protein [Prolixibacter]PSK85348.1 septum formation initiator [Prolixibacter denitrificans]GET19968.1 hypothetical protein JCM18694_02140 [Prolixibacter denitrificans]GET26645.1 hypothetical protein NT017_29740 [Prolixibacter sp. NT017]
MPKIPRILLRIVANKYLLAFVIFFVWMTFLDDHNFISLFQDQQKLHKLKADKAYYEHKIESDRRKLKELQTDSQNLEKFAREQYLMKKKNEDIFIIEEK